MLVNEKLQGTKKKMLGLSSKSARFALHSTIKIGKQHKKQIVMVQNAFIFITITFKKPPLPPRKKMVVDGALHNVWRRERPGKILVERSLVLTGLSNFSVERNRGESLCLFLSIIAMQ